MNVDSILERLLAIKGSRPGTCVQLTEKEAEERKKEKEEKFYDLQLQVQGCNDLHGSLRHFVREERLSGDNQWNTRDPSLGKQDARRATRPRRQIIETARYMTVT